MCVACGYLLDYAILENGTLFVLEEEETNENEDLELMKVLMGWGMCVKAAPSAGSWPVLSGGHFLPSCIQVAGPAPPSPWRKKN